MPRPLAVHRHDPAPRIGSDVAHDAKVPGRKQVLSDEDGNPGTKGAMLIAPPIYLVSRDTQAGCCRFKCHLHVAPSVGVISTELQLLNAHNMQPQLHRPQTHQHHHALVNGAGQ
jgi:hypothetical protein